MSNDKQHADSTPPVETNHPRPAEGDRLVEGSRGIVVPTQMAPVPPGDLPSGIPPAAPQQPVDVAPSTPSNDSE